MFSICITMSSLAQHIKNFLFFLFSNVQAEIAIFILKTNVRIPSLCVIIKVFEISAEMKLVATKFVLNPMNLIHCLTDHRCITRLWGNKEKNHQNRRNNDGPVTYR